MLHSIHLTFISSKPNQKLWMLDRWTDNLQMFWSMLIKIACGPLRDAKVSCIKIDAFLDDSFSPLNCQACNKFKKNLILLSTICRILCFPSVWNSFCFFLLKNLNYAFAIGKTRIDTYPNFGSKTKNCIRMKKFWGG